MPHPLTVFVCPVCEQAISRPVAPLPHEMTVNVEHGEPAVPAGYFAQSRNDLYANSDGCTLLNLTDLVGTKHHPDLGRNQGCCGRDGCDGPNLLCLRGHEIGTERSDCWMAHAAIVLPAIRTRTSAT